MSALRIRSFLGHSRRRLSVVLVLLVLGGAVAVHHGMPEMHSMPAGAVCLAVLGGAGLLTAAVSLVHECRISPPRPPTRLAPSSLIPTAPKAVAARAGPLYLRLGVIRR